MDVILRFISISVLNTVLTQALYLMLVGMVGVSKAYIAALLSGLVFTTIGHIVFSFRLDLRLKKSLFYAIYYILYSYLVYVLLKTTETMLPFIRVEFLLIIVTIFLFPFHYHFSRRVVRFDI